MCAIRTCLFGVLAGVILSVFVVGGIVLASGMVWVK